MSWRVVCISSRAKLDYKMGFLGVRSDGEERRIHIDDISVLLLESTGISLTAYLLAELIRRKIKVILCDNSHNPVGELIPYSGSYDSSGKIRSQIRWDADLKGKVWQRITQEKIQNQATILRKYGVVDAASLLESYIPGVLPGDPTNREGHAAKVYFGALFDEKFNRGEDDARNAALNYGYAILLACFNREIAACGYLTQLGIWHDNHANPFNLASDLMEPFRPIFDDFVRGSSPEVFGKEEKRKILDLLNRKVRIANASHYLNNAIGVYVKSIFTALEENNMEEIRFPGV